MGISSGQYVCDDHRLRLSLVLCNFVIVIATTVNVRQVLEAEKDR